VTTPGFQTKIITGIAELLGAAGIGQWAPTGQWSGVLPWITLVDMPEAPDAIITLTPYPGQASGLTDVLQMVQVRVRGDRLPQTSIDLLDSVYDRLHGRRHTVLGTTPNTVNITQILWRSTAALGQDINGRWQWTANYAIYSNRYAAGVID
jgi:hypothetical protein